MLNTRLVCSLFIVLLWASPVHAQVRSSFSSAGGSASGGALTLDYTIGETISGGTFSSSSFQLTTGFYLPPEGEDLAPPAVTPLNLPISGTAGNSLTIEATITDPGSGIATATLFLRRGDQSAPTEFVMTNSSNDTYSATIPAENITETGAEFHLIAQDNNGNITTVPSPSNTTSRYPILVELSAPGLEAQLLSGTSKSQYRLISTPLNLQNKSSSTVLSDLGTYDKTKWRLWSLKSNYFDFEGDAQFTEHNNGTSFEPGSALFILSADGGTVQTGNATTFSLTAPFTKTLHRGWNFIGNPFAFNLPISALTLSNGMSPNVMGFSGGWSAQSTLIPFQGYIIDAGSDADNVTLTIDPSRLNSSKTSQIASSAESRQIDWQIQIDAESSTFFDNSNYLGVGNVATEGKDDIDHPEPPQFGLLSVYFPHSDWSYVHPKYQTDFRPPIQEGEEWDIEVISNTQTHTTLHFSGIEDVPMQYGVQLIDLQTNITADLRSDAVYTLLPTKLNQPYKLRLTVGNADYLDEQIKAFDLLPAQVELDQNYPNPFNPTTSIRFGVQSDATVSLEVYNLMGQKVATLLSQAQKPAGYHIVQWDATSDKGLPVASGFYLYKLHVSFANQSSQNAINLTRKMLLIK